MVGDLRSKFHLDIESRSKAEKHLGIPTLTEANREKASHKEIIDSMKR